MHKGLGRPLLLAGLLLAGALLAANPVSPPVAAHAAAPVQYVDVTAAVGVDFRHYNGARGNYYYVETYGSGAGFFDYDHDGWMDIYLVNGRHLTGLPPDPMPTNHLYRNRGDGTFADVTTATGTGDTGYGMGCSAADYDNDGDQDLYIANFGPNVLYRNEGNGTFTDVTAQTGTGDSRWGTSCGFLDYDGDGDLDLFVANYVDYALERDMVCKKGKFRSYCDPDTYTPVGAVLYRNDGERFTDVTREAGITLTGRGLGVALSDYDQDGDTDIYVANDGTMNLLYENRGGSFVEVGLQTNSHYNTNGRAMAGMGVDFGDVDHDGWQDIIVGNFSYETNTLYHNTGQGYFVDDTDRLGISQPTYLPLTFGARFLDYDNDGDLDIASAAGHVLDNIAAIDPALTYRQPNQMLRNEGGKRFVDVSTALGPDFVAPKVGRALATADYDNDGDVDLLVSAEADRAYLLRNEGGDRSGHWLLLRLVGRVQRDALGARVTVTAGGRRQVKERQSGGSYLSTHDPRLHFGLGEATLADVEVTWPDGRVQRLADVAADQILEVVQAAP